MTVTKRIFRKHQSCGPTFWARERKQSSLEEAGNRYARERRAQLEAITHQDDKKVSRLQEGGLRVQLHGRVDWVTDVQERTVLSVWKHDDWEGWM